MSDDNLLNLFARLMQRFIEIETPPMFMDKRMNPYTQICIFLIFVLPSWAMAQTAPMPANSGAKMVKDAAYISGSIYPTLIPPTSMTRVKSSVIMEPHLVVPPDDAEITSVCIASSTAAQICGASLDATSANRSSCGTESSYDDARGLMTETLMVCHGKYEPAYSHLAHTAFCDVDDVGLSDCLSRYANALVRHPAPAKHVVRVSIHNSRGAIDVLTVLATDSETSEQIKTEALKGRPNTTVDDISMN